MANAATSALAFLELGISHAEEASVARHANHLATSSATTSVSIYSQISTTAANVAIGVPSTIFTLTDRAPAEPANTEVAHYLLPSIAKAFTIRGSFCWWCVTDCYISHLAGFVDLASWH